MHIHQLDHFLALVDTGSFSRAAERVHLTQPALSRSILALEEELGARLFDRLGRRNELTQAGAQVATYARRIQLELTGLRRSALMVDSLEAGNLRLGLGSAPYQMLAVGLLSHFLQSYPGVKMRLKSGAPEALFQALRERALDALVIHKRFLPSWDDIEVQLMSPLPLGFLCRAGHPLEGPGRLSYQRLSAFPVVASGIGLSVEVVQLLNERFGREAHFDDLIRMQSDDIACLLDLARGTDAVFFGVVQAGRRLIAAGELIELSPSPALNLSSQFAFVTLRGEGEVPVVREARKAVLSILGDG